MACKGTTFVLSIDRVVVQNQKNEGGEDWGSGGTVHRRQQAVCLLTDEPPSGFAPLNHMEASSRFMWLWQAAAI